MVLGNEIVDMDHLAVLTEVFLTGVTIVFSIPLTQGTLLQSQFRAQSYWINDVKFYEHSLLRQKLNILMH